MFQTVDQVNLWDQPVADVAEGTSYGYDEEAKEFFWVFYLRNALGQGEEVKVFEQVTIPTGLTVEDANAMMSTFEVNVKAEAVQVENLELPTSRGAQKAFEKVGMPLESRY